MVLARAQVRRGQLGGPRALHHAMSTTEAARKWVLCIHPRSLRRGPTPLSAQRKGGVDGRGRGRRRRQATEAAEGREEGSEGGGGRRGAWNLIAAGVKPVAVGAGTLIGLALAVDMCVPVPADLG